MYSISLLGCAAFFLLVLRGSLFFFFLRGRIGAAQTLTLVLRGSLLGCEALFGLWGSNGEVEIVLADEFAEVDEGVAHSTERGVDADACDLGYLLEG